MTIKLNSRLPIWTSVLGFLVGLTLFSFSALAQEVSDEPAEEPALKIQSKTQNGFTATAALVNDPDWASRWSADAGVVPEFNLAEIINAENTATLLIFFSDPSREEPNIAVSCEMEIRDSRREVVARIDPTVCLTVSSSSEEADVYLFPEMELTDAHGTRSGPLKLAIAVTDEVRKERIELNLQIDVEKKRR